MADLLKEAKRGKPLPRVTGGYVYTGQRFVDEAMRYTLTINSKHAQGVGYELRLSEAEMIHVCAEWMASLSKCERQRKPNAA